MQKADVRTHKSLIKVPPQTYGLVVDEDGYSSRNAMNGNSLGKAGTPPAMRPVSLVSKGPNFDMVV